MKNRMIAGLLMIAVFFALCPASLAAESEGVIGQAAADRAAQALSLQSEAEAPDEFQLEAGLPENGGIRTLAAGTAGTWGENLTWTLSDGTLTVSGTGEMKEIETLDDIPWGDFQSSIRAVIVTSGVTSLSRYSFCLCPLLTSVSFPDTLTAIGNAAFAECTSLASITLPAGIEKLSYALFSGCTSLSEIKAPGVRTIDDYVFERCPFTTFEVGKNVTEISGIAFFGAKINAYTVEAGNTVFSAVDGVLYADGGKTLFAYPTGKSDSSFTIPTGVTKVYRGAFLQAENLTHVTVPDSVSELDESSFQEAGLTEVTIPDSVTVAGYFTFYGCALQTVTLGRGLRETSYQMFRECRDLTTIHFPDTPLRLYAHTFAYCDSLTEVVLPDTVTYIGNACFGECTSLRSFVGNGLTVIPFQAFMNCYSLTDLTFDRVKNIYRAAFYGCGSLGEVTLPESIRYVHSFAFPANVRLNCKNPELSAYGVNGLARIQTVSISGYDDYSAAYEVLDLVNAERAKQGLGALTMDKELLECAMQRAAEASVLFSHTRTDGSHINEMNSKIWGENIAAGQASPAEAMESWMHSEGHRANILAEDYTSIGIGCFKINGCCYWVQDFSTEDAVSVGKPADRNVTNQVRLALDQFSEATISNGVSFDFGANSGPYKIEIILSLDSSRLQVGESIRVTALAVGSERFGDGVKIENTGCVWTGTDPTVAAVDGAGNVTALKEGHTGIELTLGIVHECAFLAVGNAPLTQFVDVSDSAYYTDAVIWAAAGDITTGVDDTHFSPKGSCTRAQIVTFLWRYAGQPTPLFRDNPFVDVSPDAYYYNAVLWAVEQGITTGMDATHFAPEGICSRAQIVTFLWRAAGQPLDMLGMVNHSFFDVRVDAFYYDAMLWAVSCNVTTGVDVTHFDPSGACVRGQAVTFLYRAQDPIDWNMNFG